MFKSKKKSKGTPRFQRKTLLLMAGSILVVALLIGAALWYVQKRRQPKTETPTLATTLADDQNTIAQYKDYPYKVDQADLATAGFTVKKRLYPNLDPQFGVQRFMPPTEYFEVALPDDGTLGITILNIVGVSAKKSGVAEKLGDEKIAQLFADETSDEHYNSVRRLPDGRIKAELASEGCLLAVSGQEKEKVQKLVSILLPKCTNLVQEQATN